MHLEARNHLDNKYFEGWCGASLQLQLQEGDSGPEDSGEVGERLQQPGLHSQHSASYPGGDPERPP